MKVYVFADMEGISGISGSEFVTGDGRYFQEGRLYYTWDINACVRGCFDAGASGVIVRDGHGSSNIAVLKELDQRAEIVQGHSERRMPGLGECDALILLGYHAMAGTPNALLEHTFSSANIQNMWMNGRLVGEIGIDAGIAADHGLPTIMVSGDDKACKEAQQWIPGVITCQVKEGLSCQSARLLSLDIAHSYIQTKTMQAVRQIPSMSPMPVERPVTIRKEVVERGYLPNEYARPSVRVIDGRTVEVTADTVEQAFSRF